MKPDIDYRINTLNSLYIHHNVDSKSTRKESDESQQRREQIGCFHKEVLDNDPVFYGKLACWYITNGDIRDRKEMFIGNMFVSNLCEHRNAAHIIMSEWEVFAPYQVARIIDYVEKDLDKNIPRVMKTAIIKWFDCLQNDKDRFDDAALQSRPAMKFLARHLHLRLTEYAQNILFKKVYPDGSVFGEMKRMSSTEMKPDEIMKVIKEHNIPPRIAATFIRRSTSPIKQMPITEMSQQENTCEHISDVTTDISGKTDCELVLEIMATELPERTLRRHGDIVI